MRAILDDAMHFLSRRDFLLHAPVLPGIAKLLLHSSRSGRELAVALLLPAGSDVQRGARFGVAEAAHAARLFRTEFEAIEAADEPDIDAAVERAAAAGVVAVVGGGGNAEAGALAAAARGANVVAFNVGGTAAALRACDPLLFHIAPDDRTIAAVRAHADGDVAHVDGVTSWHPSLSRYGAEQLNERFARLHGRGMNAAEWQGWMAVKVAWEASQRAGSVDAPSLDAFLTGERAVFDGHKGIPLSFHPRTRQLRQPLYIVRDGAVQAEVPSPRLAAETPPAQLLDAITTPEANACAP